MADALITDCRPDGRENSPFAGAMDDYGEPADRGRWPWNVLARDAVVYSCGAIALPGTAVPHRHPAAEFALCRRLSAEAEALTSPEPFTPQSWLYLVRTSSTNSFLGAFFVVANEGAPAVTSITADEIRRAFGGTIYPPAEVRLEPLREGQPWWKDLAEHYASEPAAAREEALGRWQTLIRWFEEQSGLLEPSFVVIGEERLDDWQGQENLGCTFPRLLVGRTPTGSLVGVAGQVVQA
jgi:hypothetical protein